MSFVIITHQDCLGHFTPPGHPERVERQEAVNDALAAAAFADAQRVEAPLVAESALLRAHPKTFVELVLASEPEQGWASLDPDTHLSPGSLLAIRRAAGACVHAVDLVVGGKARRAFCATRPPGHHAKKATAMGFCFFSNAAVGGLHALESHGLSRIAIADFDVHHGNGTQDIFWSDPRTAFCSSHQWPLYPGTGRESETGAGNIFNATLPPQSDGAAFRKVWDDRLLPAIDAHRPELMIISAGFDAHTRDPLANLLVEDEDFSWVTERLVDLAETHCGGRVVSILEGGYDLTALASSTTAHCKVLMRNAN